MKLELLNRNMKQIELMNIDKINFLVLELKKYIEKNPTKGLSDRIRSLFASETFNTLFTEGEVSSRRSIRESFLKDDSKFPTEQKIKNFINAYNFVMTPKEFSISNFFALYKLISVGAIEKEAELKDGEMFRSEDVFIRSNQLAGDFKGFDPKDIQKCLKQLCDFLNESELDIYLKSIIGHIYFEMIHPYYDFNGRTGRFIPLWLFSNSTKADEMLYFATAIGNFKEQYRSMFNKNIDHKTYDVNMDEMVIKLLKLLITNQHQYIWVKTIEKKYIEKTNKSFTNLQKDFIWRLMNKSETSSSTESWFKFSEEDKEYVEINLRLASLSNDTIALRDAGILEISSDKPRKYKLNGYELCPIR